MRTREQNREYIQRYRYKKKLSKTRHKEDLCYYCGGKVETLHHINENQSDNHSKNLLPLCQKCHLEIPHQCDKNGFYDNTPLNMPLNARRKPVEPVTLEKTTSNLLKNCNTGRFYNVTLLKPNSNIKIHISEGSRRLVEMFMNLGFTVTL